MPELVVTEAEEVSTDDEDAEDVFTDGCRRVVFVGFDQSRGGGGGLRRLEDVFTGIQPLWALSFTI